MDMVFLLTDDVIFMHGGYADNYLFDDVWYFDLTTLKWLEKKRFVYPRYPDSCTDDWHYIQEHNCSSLSYPLALDRDVNSPYSILPMNKQPYHYPDYDTGPYFNIFPKGKIPDAGNFSWTFHLPVWGTPMVPFAATGPLQYVRSHSFYYNISTNITIYESCTSVFAEPTRGKVSQVLLVQLITDSLLMAYLGDRMGASSFLNREEEDQVA
jgi:hypothetical protein